MKTRTMVLLVMALLVLGAFPASASDSQEDVCDGLLNALDVLENQTPANQRAIDNVTAQAADAGCLNPSELLCKSLGGTFTAYEFGYTLWNCSGWTSSNIEASTELLREACLNDVPGLFSSWERDDGGVISQTSVCIDPR